MDRIQECAAHRFLLEGVWHGAEECVASEKPRHGDGERAGGYIAECSETCVIHLLLATLGV